MNPKYFRARLMDDLEVGGEGGGGGAAAAPAAPAPPPPGAPLPGDKATPAGTLAPAASALSGGNEWTPQSIPEKYRVNGEDGQLDLAATVRKVDEHRSALEKRMGVGDIRPKTADEYKLPETDAFKALPLDPATTKAFQAKAHGWGLSQSQYENVMAEYATLAPQLVQAGQAETVDSAVGSLKEAWGADYDKNIRESHRVVSRVAESAGIPYDEVEKAIGNNPVAIRLFAALAPEMREDSTPAAANGAPGAGAQTHQEYISENWAAYSNPRDPKHAAVSAQAAKLAAKGSPTR